MPELRAGEALPEAAYAALVQRAILDCFKWSLSAGDVPVTCRYPLLLSRRGYRRLAALAEALDAEAREAERELLARPRLLSRLGLPRGLPALLAGHVSPSAPRYTRFDFHPTREGLRITESNCDVAGGLPDASSLTSWFAREVDGFVAAGDPAAALAASLRKAWGEGARVGLAHLQGCTDDRQVVLYLAKRFAEAGLRAVPFDPTLLRPGLRAGSTALDALFRFVPGDWLARLPASTGWRELFLSGRVTNPLGALAVASKRFPCLWSELETPLPTWRALLPQTREPSTARLSPSWVVKPAYGFEGVNIALDGATPEKTSLALRARARRSPGRWAVQRRFELERLATPDGPRFAVVGIYVVDGRACGAWARVSNSGLIDATAQEAVVLVEKEAA